jgi:hypothetical protein
MSKPIAIPAVSVNYAQDGKSIQTIGKVESNLS